MKGYVFLSFAIIINKNICKNKIKTLSGKYSQKLLDHSNKSARDALKTASKKSNPRKTAETTCDWIRN